MTSNPKRSKKRSVTNSRRQPDLVFFTDRNLGRYFPKFLAEKGLKVKIHDDHFPQDTSDEKWLEETGRQHWVVVTKDKRIRYRKLQSEAILKFNIRVFVLTGQNVQMRKWATLFVELIPKIKRFLDRYQEPFIAKVYKDGRISRWL